MKLKPKPIHLISPINQEILKGTFIDAFIQRSPRIEGFRAGEAKKSFEFVGHLIDRRQSILEASGALFKGLGLRGLGSFGFRVLGFRVFGFRVLGFRVFGFRVLGFIVLGFRVLGFRVLGF